MAYLMRKITLSKWIQEQHDGFCADEINAESLSDLCADENAISTWYIGNKTEEEIQQAVLALVSGFRTLDEIKIVFLDDVEIRNAGLNIEVNEGITKIPEYSNLHRDIAELNAGKLVKLAELVLKKVWEAQTQTINTEQLTLWLIQVINDGKLKFEDLDKNFKIGFASKTKKLINKNKICFEDLDIELQHALETQWIQNKKRTNCKYELECPKYRHAS